MDAADEIAIALLPVVAAVVPANVDFAHASATAFDVPQCLLNGSGRG